MWQKFCKLSNGFISYKGRNKIITNMLSPITYWWSLLLGNVHMADPLGNVRIDKKKTLTDYLRNPLRLPKSRD